MEGVLASRVLRAHVSAHRRDQIYAFDVGQHLGLDGGGREADHGAAGAGAGVEAAASQASPDLVIWFRGVRESLGYSSMFE